MTEKGVKDSELGVMSLVTLPFSLKFLVAPILDTVRDVKLIFDSIWNLSKKKIVEKK